MSDPLDGLDPLPVDEAVAALRAAADRDELLLALLRGATSHLLDVQIYVVRGNELHGMLAVDDEGLDDVRVRQRRLPLQLLSVACRVVQDGILYIGPVPAIDPLTTLVSAARLEQSGIVLLPIGAGNRTICLLVGHPRAPLDRAGRDALARLGEECSLALQELIRVRRASGGTPKVAPGENEAPAAAAGEPGAAEPTAAAPSTDAPTDGGAGKKRRRPTRRPEPVVVGGRGQPAADEPAPTLQGVPAVKLGAAKGEPDPAEAQLAERAVFLLTRKKATKGQERAKKSVSRKKPALEVVPEESPQTPVVEVAPARAAKPAAAKPAVAKPKPVKKRPAAKPGVPKRRPKRERPPLERREYRRFPLRVEVNQSSEHNFFTGFLEDISEGGLFIATYEPAKIGDRFEVTFTVPGYVAECTTLSEVCWIRGEEAGEGLLPGMGLRFIDLPKTVRAPLQAFIKRHQSIFYEP